MPDQDTPPPQRVASVDLGSNSFHMLIARLVGGQLEVIDRLREPVRLAEGLTEDHRLRRRVRERALACLERFGQRLRAMPRGSVRVVGTNTLRKARGAGDFLAAAEEALGHPIEIVRGNEEARLIYLGIAHSVAHHEGRRLVVDIGGGSTECILGEGFEVEKAHSLYMGCVQYTGRYFGDGRITNKAMKKAVLQARLELEPVRQGLVERGWSRVIGASGTIRAIDAAARANGWCDGPLTPGGVHRLQKELVAAKRLDAVAIEGLKRDRVPVIAGGVAILAAVVDSLGIEALECSSGALREGVLFDLVGRIRHEDVRERTIHAFQRRYHVDVAQASRVAGTARELLDQVQEAWGLDHESAARLLGWCAHLHEIGLAVSYSHYNRHGGYLIEHSDMPGFSRDDQRLVAAIVASHRRKVVPEAFAQIPPRLRGTAEKLTVLLRLAVLLHRGRANAPAPRVRLAVRRDRDLEITMPAAWWRDHPLVRLDLELQARYLRALGVHLHITNAAEDPVSAD